MQNNKILLLSFLLVLIHMTSFAQEDTLTSLGQRNKKYALLLYLGGGAGYFPSNGAAPAFLSPKLRRINPITTARIMWKPDYRLKAGFETGYATFYSYTLTDSAGNRGKIALNAIPMLLEFSVTLKKHLNLFGGPGVYLLSTDLDYAGKIHSRKLTMGWMAALTYLQPLTKKLGIGAEAKWLYASETIRGTFGLQLQLMWRFLEW
jgi:hypothetical protein